MRTSQTNVLKSNSGRKLNYLLLSCHIAKLLTDKFHANITYMNK